MKENGRTAHIRLDKLSASLQQVNDRIDDNNQTMAQGFLQLHTNIKDNFKQFNRSLLAALSNNDPSPMLALPAPSDANAYKRKGASDNPSSSEPSVRTPPLHSLQVQVAPHLGTPLPNQPSPFHPHSVANMHGNATHSHSSCKCPATPRVLPLCERSSD